MNPNSLSRKGFRLQGRGFGSRATHIQTGGPGPGARSFAAAALVALVRVYQRVLSPLIRLVWGNVCRFEPSCSNYAVACLETHGALRGGLLSITRLCKCHPFHPGGHDPPPPGRSSRLGRSLRASGRAHDPAGTFALGQEGAGPSRRAS